MPKYLIHVNGHTIRANIKHGTREPPFIVRRGRSRKVGMAGRVQLLLPDGEVVAELVYQPDKPLSCGARAWLETDLEVKLIGESIQE